MFAILSLLSVCPCKATVSVCCPRVHSSVVSRSLSLLFTLSVGLSPRATLLFAFALVDRESHTRYLRLSPIQLIFDPDVSLCFKINLSASRLYYYRFSYFCSAIFMSRLDIKSSYFVLLSLCLLVV